MMRDERDQLQPTNKGSFKIVNIYESVQRVRWGGGGGGGGGGRGINILC